MSRANGTSRLLGVVPRLKPHLLLKPLLNGSPRNSKRGFALATVVVIKERGIKRGRLLAFSAIGVRLDSLCCPSS